VWKSTGKASLARGWRLKTRTKPRWEGGQTDAAQNSGIKKPAKLSAAENRDRFSKSDDRNFSLNRKFHAALSAPTA
jgi:hypothetical protein